MKYLAMIPLLNQCNEESIKKGDVLTILHMNKNDMIHVYLNGNKSEIRVIDPSYFQFCNKFK